MKKQTSFGTMEILLERDGKVISELMQFKKEGRSHSHSEWENCFVINGEGTVIIGEKEQYVKKGSVCKIPPHTGHWMIPNQNLEILIVYSEIEI